MQAHQIKAEYNKELSFIATIDEYKIAMDTTDEQTIHAGPSPKKLMLASLAGCTGIDVVSILNKMKVAFSEFSIDIKANLTEEHPKIYNQVEIIYTIKISKEDEPKMQRAVDLSKDKYCGVSAMFSKFATINWVIHYL